MIAGAKIDVAEVESRYDRQERITWWDQSRLLASRVLVVGAGALGNEIVKNLALVGVGEICVVDMDRIEHANLSRCAFFRTEDAGRLKAEVLAERAAELNPDIKATHQACRVERLGIGWIAGFDLVVCGLDNRETRAWVNQACRKATVSWIDGAIEGLQGLVRTFEPSGPCYECTLGETDRKVMEHRRSCALLSPGEMQMGRVPTNATTSSIVAGVQVQEAVKMLVGRPDLLALRGKAWVLIGETMLTYTIDYVEDDLCMAHDTYKVDWSSARAIDSLADLPLDEGTVAIDFEEDLITTSACESCGSEGVTRFRSALEAGAGICPACDLPRKLQSRTCIATDDPVVRATWSDLGPALAEVVTIRTARDRQHFVLSGEETP